MFDPVMVVVTEVVSLAATVPNVRVTDVVIVLIDPGKTPYVEDEAISPREITLETALAPAGLAIAAPP